jgi:transcriptional regulator with XRE-family HTH domain
VTGVIAVPEPTNARLFGELLRAFREEAGLTQAELAKAAYCSQPLISGLENGTKGTRVDTIKAIDDAVGAKGKLVLIWPVTASGGQLPENLAELEVEASRIEDWDSRIMPGLLQTEEYMRAVMRSGLPQVTEAEREDRVRIRVERQQHIWQREKPPLLWFIIDEAVLYRPYGGKDVMREQLLRLVSAAEQPGTIIQVLRFSSVCHPGFEGPLRIMHFSGNPSIWYTEGWKSSGRLSAAKDEVSEQIIKFDLIRAAAIPPDQSVEFIASVRISNYE